MTGRAMVALAAVLLAAPAAAQEEGGWLITGATVHTLVEGEAPLEDASVLIRDGRIVAIGDVAAPEVAERLDATGLHVYPGMMDSVSQLGLTEIGAIAATVDTTELGEMNPHLRVATAVHPASEHLPVARANGITHAVVAPGGIGGRGGAGITGQASIVNLDGWTVEEMGIQPSAGMVLVWPDRNTRSFNMQTFQVERRPFREADEAYRKAVAELADVLAAARRHAAEVEAGTARRDLRLEALGPVLDGDMPFLVVAHRAREIREAVAFAEEQRVRMILLGGNGAWEVKELLADKGVPVILGPTQRLPSGEDAPYDRPFTTPGELHAAGVTVAFATFGSANSRLLPYEAGHAVGYGLPRDEAIRAITVTPARLFGLDEDFGTIEEGKVANLILVDGDPLEIRTGVRHVFIDGVPVPLDNRHQDLYEKYRARPARER